MTEDERTEGYNEAVMTYLNNSITEFPADEPDNLMGARFGKLTVCMPTPKVGPAGRVWLCRCSCGTIVQAGYRDLVERAVLSCGCRASVPPERAAEDMSGSWRGMLHVMYPKDASRLDEYICRCECGRVVTRTAEELNVRGPKSCGCLEASCEEGGPDLSGMKHHPLRLAWSETRYRCVHRTGRDGICHEFCSEWEDYRVFYHWAYSHGWKPGLVVHRLDMTRPYGPDNCIVGDRASLAHHRRSRRTKREMESESIINRSESISE